MLDRNNVLKFRMKTSTVTLGDADVLTVTAFSLVFLAACRAALWSRVKPWFWGSVLLSALVQVAWHHRLIQDRTREGCFKAFRLNHWLGFTVFVGVVAGIGLR